MKQYLFENTVKLILIVSTVALGLYWLSKSNFKVDTTNSKSIQIPSKESTLENTNFENADLSGANLEKANVNNTNFLNACYDLSTKFDVEFDPNKAKMQLVKPSQDCQNQENKVE